MDSVIAWQRVEGALVFGGAVAVYLVFGDTLPWWVAVLVFFAPDLSFAAYLAGPRAGAVVYNLWHLYGLGAALMATGFWTDGGTLAQVGTLWLAHAGFDRALGYGLKRPTGFADTHLGRIGRG
jgi:hypothetical protein